jgi:transcriptional regulator with XRE-family HTH domain
MTADAIGGKRDSPGDRPRTAAAAPEHGLNPLQRLIQQRLRERGWSYGEVARRSGLPRSTVYTLARTRNLARPPRPATLDGLAKGLDVAVSAVRAAAAESTGLHYYDEVPAGPETPGDPERDLLIASIDELTPEDRRHVAALVESLRNRASPESAGPLGPQGQQPHGDLLGRGLLPDRGGRAGPQQGLSTSASHPTRPRSGLGTGPQLR